MCCQVLATASSVVRSLPALSLANENQITGLAAETLTQVSGFLKQMASPQSGADTTGKM